MKKCLIVPYFGNFPNYFQLTLNSCGNNLDFDWLIFTDNQEKYNYPSNVKVYNMSFEEFKTLVQNKLKKYIEKISLEVPYKLCDYKVTYGYVLNEYLKEYDWWGYCDFDIIFGKLSNFITNDLLSKYDKLFVFGHLTLFRNTEEINTLFLKEYNGEKLYKKYLEVDNICVFDELWKGSINNIFESYNKKIFYKNYSADIYHRSADFKEVILDLENKKYKIDKKYKGIYLYNEGRIIKIFRHKKRIIENEYLYIHLQKRKMNYNHITLKEDCFKIIPNSFENLEIDLENINYKNFYKIKRIKLNKDYIVKKIKYSYLVKRFKTIIKSIKKRISYIEGV